MKLMTVILAAMVTGLPAPLMAQTNEPTLDENQRPVVVPENTRSNVTNPPEDRQVAVLSIALEYTDGELRSARVLSNERINSYAPKVFQRKNGDWQVVINGANEQLRFFVNDPGMQEAYPRPETEERFQYIARSGSITWPLVVPLYADGRALNARSITISDVETGDVILEVDI